MNREESDKVGSDHARVNWRLRLGILALALGLVSLWWFSGVTDGGAPEVRAMRQGSMAPKPRAMPMPVPNLESPTPLPRGSGTRPAEHALTSFAEKNLKVPPTGVPFEVCGGAPIAKTEIARAKRDSLQLRGKPLLLQALKAVEKSGTEIDKATALAAQVLLAQRSVRDHAEEDNPACGMNFECAKRIIDHEQASVKAPLQALVAFASTSTEPAVIATAFHVCASFGNVCGEDAPTAARWARNDPDNTMAWLFAALEASMAQNKIEFEAAMRLAARAKTLAARRPQLASLRLVPPLDRLDGADRVFMDEFLRSPGLGGRIPILVVRDWCAPDGPGVRDRTADCLMLADQLTSKHASRFDWMVGSAVGAKHGLDTEKLARLNRDAAALDAFGNARNAQPYRCEEQLRRILDDMESATLGETGAALKRMAESGEPNSMWAND